MDLDSDCVSHVASSVRWIDEIHITIQVDVKFDGFGLASFTYKVTRLCTRLCGLALAAAYTRENFATAYSIFALIISTLHVLSTFSAPNLPCVILLSFSVVTLTRRLHDELSRASTGAAFIS